MVKITSIQTKRVEGGDDSRLVGIARVVIEHCFVIEDIRIIKGTGDRSLFIGFPSRRKQNMEWKDMCHPIDAKTRKYFEDTILDHFNKKDVDIDENSSVNN